MQARAALYCLLALPNIGVDSLRASKTQPRLPMLAATCSSVSSVPLPQYQVPGSNTLWLTLYMHA